MRPPVRLLVALLVVAVACSQSSSNPSDGPPGDGPVIAAPSDAPRAPSCDDPALPVAFAACQQAVDEAGCTAAGGRWANEPTSTPARCFCPTGQDGCSCSRAGDCLGLCYDPTWPLVSDCTTVPAWVCSAEYPVLMCHCSLGAAGEIGRICMD
jgi:hypothetical protein